MIKDYCIVYSSEGLRLSILREAIKDYKYLLTRGYTPKQILPFISNRYGLSRIEQLLIYRSIHDNEYINNVKTKIQKESDIRGQVLLIDGLNVILAIQAAINCKPLVRGDDGFIRDVQRVHGKVKYSNDFFSSIIRLGISLKYLEPRRVLVFFDKNISLIGFYSSIIRKLLSLYANVDIDIVLSSMCDKSLINMSKQYDYIVSSSDAVLIMKSRRVFDLAGFIINLMLYSNVIDVNSLI